MPVTFYYQWAKPGTNIATIQIYLDDDLNPLNGNQTLLREIPVPASGASFVNFTATNLTLAASNASPGYHAVFAKIAGGGRTRFLYAPELVQVAGPPTLGLVKLNATQYRVEVNGSVGQTIVLQSSTNFQSWLPLATNILATNFWFYTNTPPGVPVYRFYRGMLGP